MSKQLKVGGKFTVAKGTRIYTQGLQMSQQRTRDITIRALEATRDGKTRVVWKSMGHRTTTVV